MVPNSKLSQSVATNYNLPERRMAIVIPVSASYDSDPAMQLSRHCSMWP